MSALQPSYFLAPDFDIPPPPHGPLHLGNIITNIKDPLYPLNSNDRILPTDSTVYTTLKKGFTATRTDVQQGKAGIWAKVALTTGLKAEASLNSNRTSNDIFEVREIETTFFAPDQEYLEKSLNVPGVKEWLEASRWRKTIYVIVGLKIARGITFSGVKFRGRGAKFEANAGGELGAVPLQAGAELSGSIAKIQTSSFEESSDIVFGYRLRKISYKRGKPIRHGQVTTGAMFGVDDGYTSSASAPNVSVVDVGEECLEFGDLEQLTWTLAREADEDHDCLWIIAKDITV